MEVEQARQEAQDAQGEAEVEESPGVGTSTGTKPEVDEWR